MGFLWWKKQPGEDIEIKPEDELKDVPEKEIVTIEQQPEIAPKPKKPEHNKQPQTKAPEKKVEFKCYRCNYKFRRTKNFIFRKCPYCGQEVR